MPLRQELLGKLSGLELDHVFPTDLLYKAGHTRPQVNALANFTFLTKATNLEVTNRDPAVYIPEYEARHPGVVASHWIPMEPDLWRIENYDVFLAERRRMIAEAANRFLDQLAGGTAPDADLGAPVVGGGALRVPIESPEDDEAKVIADCRQWVLDQGLAEGIVDYELADEETGEVLANLDLAWPDGLQLELTEPVALLLNESPEVERAAAARGFRFFASVDEFRDYVLTKVLAEPAA